MASMPGVVVLDDPAHTRPIRCPLRQKEKMRSSLAGCVVILLQRTPLNLWVVSDNLRKGAATNAVQIAQWLAENGLLH